MTTLEQLEVVDRLTVITQRVGFALWQIQELEGVSAQYFVLLAKAEKGMGESNGNALVEKAQSKTFGATILQISKAGLFSTALNTRFNALLEERNWLVHRSRADSRNAIYSEKIAKGLVARLDAIAEESTALLKEIGALAELFVQQHGVSAEYIDKMSKQILEQWKNSDEL